jgi:hypothetical protein
MSRRRSGAVEPGSARTRIVAAAVLALAAVAVVVGTTELGGTSGVRQATAPPTSARPPISTVPNATLAAAPAPRFGAASTFDDATRTVVLFGGEGAYGAVDDTWIWNGVRWTRVHPRTVPPARYGALMAYDPITRQVLMTGGTGLVPLTDPCVRSPNAPPRCTPPARLRDVRLSGDLWGWDGHNWNHLLADAHQPRPLAMVTDERVGRVVLVRLTPGVLDTFTWTGHDWIYREPSTVPIEADDIGMAYDAALGRVVAIETYQPGVCMPHTGCTAPARTIAATWDGSTWRRATLTGAPPLRPSGLIEPRTVVADPAGRGLLAFDGTGATWRLRGTRWTRVASASASPGRTSLAFADDPAARQVVAFGGLPSTRRVPMTFLATNETWTWSGAAWHRLTAPVVALPPPPAPAPQDCTLNGPALVPSTASRPDSTILTVSDLFVAAPCRLSVAISVELVDNRGRLLAIAGNPATVRFDAATAPDTSSLSAAWTWRNPCAPAGGATARITAQGRGALTSPFDLPMPAPACPRPGTPSLTVTPIVVRGG